MKKIDIQERQQDLSLHDIAIMLYEIQMEEEQICDLEKFSKLAVMKDDEIMSYEFTSEVSTIYGKKPRKVKKANPEHTTHRRRLYARLKKGIEDALESIFLVEDEDKKYTKLKENMKEYIRWLLIYSKKAQSINSAVPDITPTSIIDTRKRRTIIDCKSLLSLTNLSMRERVEIATIDEILSNGFRGDGYANFYLKQEGIELQETQRKVRTIVKNVSKILVERIGECRHIRGIGGPTNEYDVVIPKDIQIPPYYPFGNSIMDTHHRAMLIELYKDNGVIKTADKKDFEDMLKKLIGESLK
jgi:hypothetical protein